MRLTVGNRRPLVRLGQSRRTRWWRKRRPASQPHVRLSRAWPENVVAVHPFSCNDHRPQGWLLDVDTSVLAPFHRCMRQCPGVSCLSSCPPSGSALPSPHSLCPAMATVRVGGHQPPQSRLLQPGQLAPPRQLPPPPAQRRPLSPEMATGTVRVVGQCQPQPPPLPPTRHPQKYPSQNLTGPSV